MRSSSKNLKLRHPPYLCL